ncbi:hypothetical protein QTP88_015542 [Uroleucon formosanum]
MTRSTREYKSDKTGKGFVNSLINSLRFEAHVPGYQYYGPADKVLENRAWERFKAEDSSRKEKLVAYAVTNAMKAKRKIGMGYKRKRLIKNNGMLAAKKKRTSKKKNSGKRLILTPGQSGGVIPLIPLFAELSALGSLMSGGASVYNAVQNSKRKKDNGVGSHWVAFHKNKDKVVYFDSFGDLPPPIELQHYFKQFKIVYNYSNYQDFNTFNCEIALLCLQSFNSFPNINENNNKFSIQVVDNENNITPMICFITLEEGCYEIEDIKRRVKKQIDDYNSKNFTDLTFDIRVDPNDFRSSIKCNGILHFEIPYSIAPVFGFEKRVYKPYIETLRSEKAVNLNTINSIKVMCNIAQGSFSNHLQSHSIYEFFPSERTGLKVIQSPSNLIYYKLNKTDIDSITVQLVDQDHNPIDNFDITSQYETDSKITKIEYHSYTPYTTSFNNNDEIRISIQQTDVYPYLHESFIFLEGMFSEADKVKLSNNGYSYLFEQIRLEINGIEVDSTRVLGITSSLKGYLSGTPDNYNCYENSGWNFKNATQSANDKGEFSACIPLKYWLGFFEDYRKILVNSRLELILTRNNEELSIFDVKMDFLFGKIKNSRICPIIPKQSRISGTLQDLETAKFSE